MVIMANSWATQDAPRSRRQSFADSDTFDESRLDQSNVSVVEGKMDFTIEAEVEGLIPSNLMISIDDQWMYVSGDRYVDSAQNGELVRVKVPFDSVIDLPFNSGEHYYLDIQDDVLQFTFPKSEHNVRSVA